MKFHFLFIIIISLQVSAETINVELENGQKVNCTRGSTKVISIEDKKKFQEKDLSLQCISYQCESISIKGKVYSPTLIYDSNPEASYQPSIHLINDQQEIGPLVAVKKIFPKNSTKPQNDYTSYLSAFKDRYDEDYMKTLPISLKDERQKLAYYKDTDVLGPLEHSNKICDQNDSGILKASKAKSKLISKLGNLELREFIQVMADGKLVNELVDVSANLKGGCTYEGVYLNKAAARKLEYIRKNIHTDKLSPKSISLKKATELFNKARNMSDISWNFKDDGCVARAHIMARRFEAEGVHVDKVWIEGKLTVPALNIEWDKHVAPIVYVEDGNSIQKMVIDPSLFDKPVTVKEWEKKMTTKIPGKTMTTAFPMPSNSAQMERASLAFSSSDAFYSDDTGSISEEKKMNEAVATMKRYKGN